MKRIRPFIDIAQMQGDRFYPASRDADLLFKFMGAIDGINSERTILLSAIGQVSRGYELRYTMLPEGVIKSFPEDGIDDSEKSIIMMNVHLDGVRNFFLTPHDLVAHNLFNLYPETCYPIRPTNVLQQLSNMGYKTKFTGMSKLLKDRPPLDANSNKLVIELDKNGEYYFP